MSNRMIGFLRTANIKAVKIPIISFERLRCLWKSAQYIPQLRVRRLYRGSLTKLLVALLGLFVVFGLMAGVNEADVASAYEGDIEAIFGRPLKCVLLMPLWLLQVKD